MFNETNSFTLNTCLLNEVSGRQVNHYGKKNDNRKDCDNQASRRIIHSNNNYVYDDEAILADDSLTSKPAKRNAAESNSAPKAEDNLDVSYSELLKESPADAQTKDD
ncbi:hypothetical protein ONZ45_g14018 [Pleurotus djamor]|nr:hypothetical protein ONZ45_g14018 [Pleurotus djamor]